MPEPRAATRRDDQPAWLLLLLAAYAVLELSFNHHLLDISGSVVAGPGVIQDLEFWARLISGLGLALWLMRALLRRGLAPLVAVVLSVVVGVTVMWHLQRWLVDAIVANASERDMQMSLYAQQLSPQLLSGQVQVRGQPLVQAQDVPEAGLGAWRALVPAIVLGLGPSDFGTSAMPDPAVAGAVEGRILQDAYRRAVMVPIALAVSLLFGLANLCLFVSLVAARCCPARARLAPWHRTTAWLLLSTVVVVWSCLWLADEVESRGYREVARPALRSAQPLLAPFVEWSLRAAPAWRDPTRWLHQVVLGGYGFERPRLARDLEP